MSGTAMTKREGSAVKVSAKPLEAAKAAGPTRRYWVGVTPDCPVQNITAGGVNFPKFSGSHLDAAGDLLPESERRHGIECELTDEQVDLVRKGVSLRVIRLGGVDRTGSEFEDAPETMRPKGRHAQVYMVDSKKYRPAPNDVPVARFLYMHRLDDMTAADRSRFPPETMLA